MEILVFKTNITQAEHIDAIGQDLNVHPCIIDWNVDLHDCDNILRIVADQIHPSIIESILTKAGYYCEELL